MYTDMYLSNTEDVRRCPSADCDYAGTITLSPCSKPLSCPECNTEWRELVQLNTYEKTKKHLKELVNFNSETFSYINEIMTGCPCPK